MTTGPGRALAVGFEGTRIPDDLVALAEQAGLGGVVLFARNCPSLEAVLALTAAARTLGPDVLILVDHEGGQVHRLPPPFTRFPPPAAVGRSGDPHLAVAVARAMAREPPPPGFDSRLALPASLSAAVIGGLLRRRLGFSGLVLSDDLEMAAVARTWGVAGAARRFLAASGDLALVCQSSEARNEAVAAIGREIDRGALDLAPAVQRRQAARRLICTAGSRPDVSVIGCVEHRALAAEVVQRAGAPPPAPA